MIFKVSEDFKGSCVLPTLERAIWAGVILSISGNDLNAGDIQDAISKGILISVDKKYKQNEQKDNEVVIVNNTNRLLTLGNRTLKANGSLPITKDEAESPRLIAAAANGFITIVSDEGEETYIRRKGAKKKAVKKVVKKKSVKKKAKAKKKEIELKKFQELRT